MSSDPKYDFSGKVALVTGSSSGIGAEIAKQFAQYGASVAITGRNAANLARVAEEIASVSGVQPLQVVGDLLDDAFPAKLISAVIEHFKKLDILVNNAGGTVPNGGLTSEKLLEEFDQTIKLNLRAPVELIQRAAPYLKKEKGNIIQISSVASTKPWTLSYSSAKAGLDMATKCAALELGSFGVRVNSINPGPVETSFHRSLGIDENAYKGFATFFKENSLLKYIGQPEDVANLASFLASDLARNITGSIYYTDSGSLLHTPEFKR